MLYPARFVAVKPPQGAYEQRLRDAEKYSAETISSLLEQAGVGVEGSDDVVVNEEVRAAAAALENYIYEREGEGKTGGEETEKKVEATVEEKIEEKVGENGDAMDEENITAEANEMNGETPQERTQEGVDQDMKGGPTDA